MKDYIATIVKNEKIAENIYAVTFTLSEDISVRCGQFGNISIGGTHLLRRPIAICKVEDREVTFCYQIKGEGTQTLKTLGAGTKLNVLMPLGNGFYVEEDEKKIALVGGGVGIAPLYLAAKTYKAQNPDCQVDIYLGFSGEPILVEEIEMVPLNEVIILKNVEETVYLADSGKEYYIFYYETESDFVPEQETVYASKNVYRTAKIIETGDEIAKYQVYKREYTGIPSFWSFALDSYEEQEVVLRIPENRIVQQFEAAY